MAAQHYGVLVLGAGISGINAAYRVQTQLPNMEYGVLEARSTVGGTWDFWKYPGLRTDSRMTIYGFQWMPWPKSTTLANGEEINSYIHQAAKKTGIYAKIQFGHRVQSTEWSTADKCWTVTVDAHGETKIFTTSWLINCMGYYTYDQPLKSPIPGLNDFQGDIIHPQFWKEDTDWAGKHIVLIGSGATAITILPNLVDKAKRVTLLQRSPSYVLPIPSSPSLERRLSWWLPFWLSSALLWWIRVIEEAMLKVLPKRVDIKHFTPGYLPGEQRVCVCPDADFIRVEHKHVDIITDTIETVTPTGIRTIGGNFIEADMIITATGLNINLWGGVDPVLDGKSVVLGESFVWRSCMIEGIPNAGFISGYISGTWTPGADIGTRTFIRVIKHCQEVGASEAIPTVGDEEARAKLPRERRMLCNKSTYMQAAQHRLPITADIGPWYKGTSWVSDFWRTFFSNVTDGLIYSTPRK
ncbi:hypothetical protein BGZ61DRAFT_539187 [Ilyonectria robusta]|uniref:uncharacterized protein n=1 Tax=Ilyonectria robusta TaxID=1079257 RepID=UPI001E8DC3D9|nr:uncharacterized protein BGZ61DRAFT_539187 [Ilyonectria robusta]KAH8663886.1 hypothetical protein BGZ61DRAFT_539187 [Ilyonectria robusta]